ncbi:MAG: carboxypeptidase regulatory-like domain-containing protein [Acidobacteria bacterium]|nr:carboxypeptidase regulatory-like domain-containing protein [Acidobacteriota bacterium]
MLRPVIALAVLLSLLAQSVTYGYQDPPQIQKLNIEIVEGEGAVNNIRQRMAREPMVQVTDENRKPVAGAAVVFLLPNQGAGATFANGAKSLTTITDANGNAVARGLQANRLSGQYQVRVTASHQGRTASTSINMSNAAIGGGIASAAALKWLLILGAAGGAAAGIAVATNSGGGGQRSPTTVTPGTPTVGAPR